MNTFRVDFFDGKSSKKTTLTLDIHDSFIFFPEKNWKFSFDQIKVSTKIKGVSQTLNLPNGGYCSVDKNDIIELKKSFVSYMESKKTHIFISLVLIIALSLFALTYGSTWSAKIVANILPQKVSQIISKESFSFLKENYLKPTKLPNSTQTYLKNSFKKITPPSLHVKLHFFNSPILKENAFALPSGDIILLDDLVLKDKDKNLTGIIGVLGHEIGHVKRKHALQNIVKSSIVGVLSAYFIGDFSTIIATLTTGLVTLNYSREFEKEADEEAAIALKKHGYSLRPLINLFKSLKGHEIQSKLFSTHPLFKERIDFLEKSIP